MGLLDFFGLKRAPKTAIELYRAIVNQSRQPEFYNRCGVPDTFGGRFDLVALHTYVVMRRLKEIGGEAGILSQQLFDVMFADMDGTLREMGVGDLGVGRKVKELAKLFYGRIKYYDEGLAGSDGELRDALKRNLFADGDPDDGQVAEMSAYLRNLISDSRGWPWEELANGRLLFRAPPVPVGGAP